MEEVKKPVLDRSLVESFLVESNRIEGIHLPASNVEVRSLQGFLELRQVTVVELEAFVAIAAHGHRLRRKPGLNVRVGSYVAPEGGPLIAAALEMLLDFANNGSSNNAYEVHQRYERLHPFTDGNGRSGRALWLWCMHRAGRLDYALALGFLHCWYYQSLEASR